MHSPLRLLSVLAITLSLPACDSEPDPAAGKADKAAKAEEKKADPAKAEEKKADEAKADEAKADEAKADEAKADEAKADEAKAGEAKADEAKADEAKEAKDAGKGDKKGTKKGGDKGGDKGDAKGADAGVDGKAVFMKKCKGCHGVDGKAKTKMGKKHDIPNWTKAGWKKKWSQAKIVKIVTNGKPDTKMKSFKSKLTPEEIKAVAGFARKLGK